MRWVYRITFTSGRVATCPSAGRIYGCLECFRNKFGADSVLSVTEQYGNGEPVPSHLLPTSREEADSIVRVDRIKRAIDNFHKRR